MERCQSMRFGKADLGLRLCDGSGEEVRAGGLPSLPLRVDGRAAVACGGEEVWRLPRAGLRVIDVQTATGGKSATLSAGEVNTYGCMRTPVKSMIWRRRCLSRAYTKA